MREGRWPWTLSKGVLSLNYPKESLIRQFLLEGNSMVVNPKGRHLGQGGNLI